MQPIHHCSDNVSPFFIEEPAIIATIADSAPSRASKPSMRRLRTETSSFHPRISKTDLQPLAEAMAPFWKISTARQEGRYEDALQLLDDLQTNYEKKLCGEVIAYAQNKFLFQTLDMWPAISPQASSDVIASLKRDRAEILALLNHQEAPLRPPKVLFEHTWKGIESAIEFINETKFNGCYLDPQNVQDIKDSLEAQHNLLYGCYKLAYYREEAISHLRAFYLAYERLCNQENDLKFPFLLKVLEEKFGEQIIPEITKADETNPKSLFLAGHYADALERLDEANRARCLAMMGKYDDAIDAFPNSDIQKPLFKALIYFLKGNLEKAEQVIYKADLRKVVEGTLILSSINGYKY